MPIMIMKFTFLPLSKKGDKTLTDIPKVNKHNELVVIMKFMIFMSLEKGHKTETDSPNYNEHLL